MDYGQVAALMGLAELAVGACYALFCKGPDLPHVPRLAAFGFRLIAPLPLLAISYFQWAYAPEKANP